MPNDDVLDTLRITRSRSNPNASTSTPDGEWLFVSEGGTVTCIDVPSQPAVGDADFAASAEKGWVQVGHSGVRAMEMALDPEAANPPGGGSSDLLYIAGGRDGLWGMKADTNDWSGITTFQRLDDSGNADPAKQRSRRWCIDVDFMYADDTWYLLALFAKKSQNRLRVYKLADARAAINAGGPEIEPWIDVPVNAHPDVPIPPPDAVPPSYGTSSAWAMAVDQVDDTPLQEQWDVYMALGHHGLVRVHFTVQDLDSQTAPSREWGPVFGDGSFYNTSTSGIPSWSEPEYYGNYDFVQKGAAPTDPFHPHHPGIDVVIRTERPLFADVAVQNDTFGHYLYAAVDHLNWVRFDLSGTSGPWDSQLAIGHHEGVPMSMPNDWNDETEFDVVESSNPKPGGRIREIELVYADQNGPLGAVPVLVASASGTLYPADLIGRVEGNTYDVRFTPGATRFIDTTPAKKRILIYDVRTSQLSQGIDAINWTQGEDAGRWWLQVPPDQDRDWDEEYIYLFFRTKSNQTCFLKLDVNGTTNTGILRRRKTAWKGRHPFTVARSIVHSDLFLFGGNDGAGPPPGIQVEGRPSGVPDIAVHQDPDGDERPLTQGTVWNPRAQWQRKGETLKQYYWTQHGSPPDDPAFIHWCLLKAHVGNDPYNGNPGGSPPDQEFLWGIAPPLDRFNNTGRRDQMEAELNPLYDVHTGAIYPENAGVGPAEMVFVVHQRPIAQGAHVLRRDVIEKEFETGWPSGNGQYPSGSNLELPDFLWPSGWDPLPLNTHPETSQIDYDVSPNDPHDATIAWDWWQADCPGSDTAVYTWRPELVEIEGSWVLVVPAGMVYMNKNWEFFQDNPQWAPTGIWDANFGHSMVLFWDVTDPKNIPMWDDGNPGSGRDFGTHTVHNDSPLPKAIGSAAEGMAWRTCSKKIQTTNGERVYCFVADFAGRVLVYDIQDILDPAGGPEDVLPEYEVWDSTPSFYDNLPNPVQGIAVDVVNPGDPDNEEVYVYASVRRVGIEVLRFHPDNPEGSRLVQKNKWRIQTSEECWELQITEDGAGVKTLLVAGYGDGFSIYED